MLSRTLGTTCCLIVAVVPCRSLGGQANAPAAIGERIRVTATSGAGQSRSKGRVTAYQADTLMLQRSEGDVRAIPVSTITKLEASAGQKTNGRKGMTYGFLGGAASGAIIGAITYKSSNCPHGLYLGPPVDCHGASGFKAGEGALFGGMLGLALGGIYGRYHRTERWVDRPLGDGHVGMTPSARGALLHISARF